jgi:hypothetical protein
MIFFSLSNQYPITNKKLNCTHTKSSYKEEDRIISANDMIVLTRNADWVSG